MRTPQGRSLVVTALALAPLASFLFSVSSFAQGFPPGSAGGDCRPDGTCDSGLRCDEGMCIVTLPGGPAPSESEPPPPSSPPPSSPPPSSPPPAAPGPRPPGSVAGPCYANGTCDAGLACQAERCVTVPKQPAAAAPPPPAAPTPAASTGAEGGPCYGNQTCNEGLICTAGSCEVAVRPLGEEGGPCYRNQTCNGGLVCDAGRCLAGGDDDAGGGAFGGRSRAPDDRRGEREGDDGRSGERDAPGEYDDEYDDAHDDGPSTKTRPADLRGSGIGALVGRCLSLPLTGAGCGLCGFGCMGVLGGLAFLGASTVGPYGDQAVLGGAIGVGAGLVFAVLGGGIGLAGAGARGYALYSQATAMSEGIDLDAIWATVVAVFDAIVTVLEIAGVVGAVAAGAAFLAVVGGTIGAGLADVDPFYQQVFGVIFQLGLPLMLLSGGALATGALLALIGLLLDVVLFAGSFAVDEPGEGAWGAYGALPEVSVGARPGGLGRTAMAF